MNKLNLIEQVLQADYYNGNIEEGSLKNNSFTIWTTGKQYIDLIEDADLFREVKRKLYTSFIKDDGAVILTFKLEHNEAYLLADILNNKRDADGNFLYRLDWSDDRDFRSKSEVELDRLLSSVELLVGNIRHQKKAAADRLGDISFEAAIDKIEPALDLLRKSYKELL